MALKNPVTQAAVRYVAPAALALAASTVAYYEGVRYRAYKDPVGILTVCYGETQGVDRNRLYTESDCRLMLEARVGEFAAQVQSLIAIPQPDTRIAALTSFAYNVGIENFRKSTLLRKLNAGDAVGACNELPRWNKAKGQVLPGLVKRREAERQLCLKGIRA